MGQEQTQKRKAKHNTSTEATFLDVSRRTSDVVSQFVISL